MDGELVNSEPSDEVDGGGSGRPFDIVKLLNEQCPIYMSYGMSYEEYWDGDNEAPRHYRELARMNVKERDHQAWLTASYVYAALTRVYPLFNPLAKDKPEPFLERPYTYEEDVPRATQEEEDKKQMEAWRAYMLAQMGGDEDNGRHS